MQATMKTLKVAGIQPWKNNVVFCCCTDSSAKSCHAAFVPYLLWQILLQSGERFKDAQTTFVLMVKDFNTGGLAAVTSSSFQVQEKPSDYVHSSVQGCFPPLCFLPVPRSMPSFWSPTPLAAS